MITTFPSVDDLVLSTGRTFAEYVRMFGLSELERPGPILGIGDGLSDFNAEATRRGWRVISVDPLYRLQPAEIEERYRRVLDELPVTRHSAQWIWACFETPEAIRTARETMMADFLDDFSRGLPAGRYLDARLPSLPFGDREFALAVCSHLLFTWSGILTFDFHLQSITELLRVAREVRVFPSRARNCADQLEAVMEHFRRQGCRVRLERMSDCDAIGMPQRLVIEGTSASRDDALRRCASTRR